MNEVEARILRALRAMSDDCMSDAVAAMEAWAKAFPRRQAPTLTLIMGAGRPTPMRKKGGERGQTV